MRATYEQQLDSYRQPEERSASHILVSLPADTDDERIEQARSRAQAINDAIISGAKTFQQTMEEVKNSEDMETEELGVISKGMFGSAFEDSLFALNEVR